MDHCREQGTLGVVGGSDALADVANSSGDQAPSSGLSASVGSATCRRCESSSPEAGEKGQQECDEGRLKACPTGTAGEDEEFWLVPIEDRRASGGTRIEISPRMDLAAYLRLLDWSSRLLRPGKCRVPKEVSRAGVWKARIRQRFVGLARDVIWLRSLNDWECRQTSGAIW